MKFLSTQNMHYFGTERAHLSLDLTIAARLHFFYLALLYLASMAAANGVPGVYFLALVPLGRGLERYLFQLAIAACTAILYKNIFLLFATGDVPLHHWDRLSIVFYLATDAALIMVAGLIAFLTDGLHLRKSIITACLIVLIYTAVGIAVNGLQSAAAYTRLCVIPIVGYMVGRQFISRRHSPEQIVLTTAPLFLLYLLVEAVYPEYYNSIDIGTFSRIKFSTYNVMSDEKYVSYMGTGILGINLSRVLGPQLHPISVGYTCAAISLCLCMRLPARIACIASLPLLAIEFVASKGALALNGWLLLSILIGAHRSTRKMVVSAILLAAVLLINASFPYSSGFEHLIGLLGGISVFLSNPFGFGLGFSGNLSDNSSKAFGAESFAGVLLAGMGVGAIVYYAALARWSISGLAAFARSIEGERAQVAGLYLLLLCVNSLLQEEAFSPSAMFIPSLLYAAAVANLPAVSPRTPPPRGE